MAALAATAPLWPPVRAAFAWVWRAARLLGEDGPEEASAVRRRLGGLLGAMVRHRGSVGALAGGIDHFVKVTRSYWAGLCHCYAVADLPRANDDVEQSFGSHRYHERRASARQGAAPGLVPRGEARLLAAAATTRQHAYTAEELAEADPIRRAELHQRLEVRRQRRVNRTRFRRNPLAFLQHLEGQLLQSALLS